MKRLFAAALFGAVGLMAALPSAHAQQKTEKACVEEWRAKKAADPAFKTLQKDYVPDCRKAAAAAPAKPAAPAAAAPATLPPAYAQQKTEKACIEEWRAKKAADPAFKTLQKDYVPDCRKSAAVAPAKPAAPAATAPAAPATAAPARQAAPAPAAPAPRQVPAPATAAAGGANQYTTEAPAKARCPSDTVVYVNLSSKIYHFAGHKDYGTLKNGTYMCEKDTAGAGARAAKNEKHP